MTRCHVNKSSKCSAKSRALNIGQKLVSREPATQLLAVGLKMQWPTLSGPLMWKLLGLKDRKML